MYINLKSADITYYQNVFIFLLNAYRNITSQETINNLL